MLKVTGIKLELMTDVDMFQPIEKGMRGGISYTANRHLEANNPYRSGYNAKKPNKYIMYLDGNNLYGAPRANTFQLVDSSGCQTRKSVDWIWHQYQKTSKRG